MRPIAGGRARGTELISPNDLVDACLLMEQLGLPMVLHTFESGVRAVRDRSQSDLQIAETALAAILELGHGSASQLALARQVWSCKQLFNRLDCVKPTPRQVCHICYHISVSPMRL